MLSWDTGHAWGAREELFLLDMGLCRRAGCRNAGSLARREGTSLSAYRERSTVQLRLALEKRRGVISRAAYPWSHTYALRAPPQLGQPPTSTTLSLQSRTYPCIPIPRTYINSSYTRGHTVAFFSKVPHRARPARRACCARRTTTTQDSSHTAPGAARVASVIGLDKRKKKKGEE